MQDELRRLEDKIDALTKIVQERLTTPTLIKTVNQSTSTVELSKALAIAQKDYKPITYLNENTYSNIAYASLMQVVDATRVPLCNNGLSVIQILFDYMHDASQILHTQLRHSSGEYVESQMIVKANGNDPVALTSYINWLKRTAYSSIVGCPIPKEDDDCIRYAQGNEKPLLRGSAAKRKDESYERINKTQYDELVLELDGYPDMAQMLMDDHEIDDLHEMRQSKWRAAITKIRENKQLLRNR
jgi:hypothetical protein